MGVIPCLLLPPNILIPLVFFGVMIETEYLLKIHSVTILRITPIRDCVLSDYLIILQIIIVSFHIIWKLFIGRHIVDRQIDDTLDIIDIDLLIP